MDKSNIADLMRRSVNGLIKISENNPPDQWDWTVGVGVLGAMRAHIVTNENVYIDFLERWVERNSKEMVLTSVNNVIPAIGSFYLWEKTGKNYYFELSEKCADWCLNDAVRTINGGFAHVWAGGNDDFKNQLWIDSVHMAVIFLIYFGKKTNNPKYIAEGLSQLSIHIAALMDTKTGYYYHGYHCLRKENIGSFWARGNGWMAATLVDCIDLIKDDYQKQSYVKILENLMETVYKNNSSKEPLHTLLHRKDSYKEMTGTMLFGYSAAKGSRCGILDSEYKDIAMDAAELTIKHFTDGDYVDLCSAGTDPAPEEVYCNRPIISSPFAHGITLSLFSEIYKII